MWVAVGSPLDVAPRVDHVRDSVEQRDAGTHVHQGDCRSVASGFSRTVDDRYGA
jgi:hypothetical protein